MPQIELRKRESMYEMADKEISEEKLTVNCMKMSLMH